VEKSNTGTFPLRLEIPQERRDFATFSTAPTSTDFSGWMFRGKKNS
jgi:hypothetical protein